MDNVLILKPDKMGRDFIPREFLPHGKDEYYLRNEQLGKPTSYWRSLESHEIETLVKNNNTCDNWDNILVTDHFNPMLIKNNKFFGLVRISRLDNMILQHHDLVVPVGITNSLIISCDIGDNVAIHNVRYLSHYIIHNRVILLNIDEMHTTNHAKFGNGIVKDGEPEQIRIWIDVINEVGTRAVMPFDGMITADAYIWAKFRDNKALQKKLVQITQCQFDSRRGFYGEVGEQSVIKNSRILKDTKVGPHCYIKGANKLKNLTINSSVEEPTQIGEGVELVNGIIGYGCHIFYGCKAVRFIIGNNCNLKYGARLIHSILGDNSTVSCCELLNNLIFPAHEQHHNNSFLIASLLLGQTNIAAGATIGSNHNSRSNDGELEAGRGFWPGLCTTFKYPSKFSSFVIVAKADYPAELNITLPFSLISNDSKNDCLVVVPAYWWLHNMYALARNSWKYRCRDKRKTKTQHIEFDHLAPDTAEQIITAINLLQLWTAKAQLRARGQNMPADQQLLLQQGKKLLIDTPQEADRLEVLGENMENSNRKVIIRKAGSAYHAYCQMLHYYAIKNILEFIDTSKAVSFDSVCKALSGWQKTEWINLGGQLVTQKDLDKLFSEIINGKLKTWNDIHRFYDQLWSAYPLQKQRHAFSVLQWLLGSTKISRQQWLRALEQAAAIQEYIREQVYATRKKDYKNPFRHITFRNSKEMNAVLASAENNPFVRHVEKETMAFRVKIEEAKTLK